MGEMHTYKSFWAKRLFDCWEIYFGDKEGGTGEETFAPIVEEKNNGTETVNLCEKYVIT